MKVSSTFSKVVESRGKASGRAPQSAEPPLCSQKRRRGSKGEPSPGVSPFLFVALYVCAVTLGGGRWPVLPFDPISLVLAQRNGVEPPKKGAFYLGGSTIRVSATGRWSGRFSPDFGERAGTCAPFSWEVVCGPNCPFHPISLLLRKETGWSPKETRFWVPPRDMFGPTRLSHSALSPNGMNWCVKLV